MTSNSVPAEKLENGRVPLSILELAPLSSGMTRKEALDTSLEVAINADKYGYQRIWVAEHHGSKLFMCSASQVIITRALENTKRIRIGAGGVMIPNWAPLQVAETYGTLATIYGDRVDLGVGRAPGTDPATARALKRGSAEKNYFEDDIDELATYLDEPTGIIHSSTVSGAEASILGMEVISVDRPFARVRAIPGEGTRVPLWMLSSSSVGAEVGAKLGLPYVFGGHFAPENTVEQSIKIYRDNFQPNPKLSGSERPVVMMGVNVMCAPSEEEAQYLFSTTRLTQANVLTGKAGTLLPPTEDLEATLGQNLANRVCSMYSIHAVGTPEQVVQQLEEIQETYQVDEIITVTHAYDPELRMRSQRMVAEAWGLPIEK